MADHARAHKLFYVQTFAEALREPKIRPHIANGSHLTKIRKHRKTAIDRRTLRHFGYPISQCCRKRTEEGFG